jgi:hypothetical protein
MGMRDRRSTLLSDEAAELLAHAPPRAVRLALALLGFFMLAVIVWAAVFPIDSTVYSRAILGVGDKGMVALARIGPEQAESLRHGQPARVHLGYPGKAAGTRSGQVVGMSGPVPDKEEGLVMLVTIAFDDPWITVAGKRRPLDPGLGVSVEVTIGETTPLRWLLGGH